MSRIKILYVDDEQINLELFKLHLEVEYDVFTALNGQTGLELLKDHPDIKVVISDMKMPVMNGIEFITQVKERYQDIRCYIFTGYDITPQIRDSITDGLILDCLSKPFELTRMNLAIRKAIAA